MPLKNVMVTIGVQRGLWKVVFEIELNVSAYCAVHPDDPHLIKQKQLSNYCSTHKTLYLYLYLYLPC